MNIRNTLSSIVLAATLALGGVGVLHAQTTGNADIEVIAPTGAGLTATISSADFGQVQYSFSDQTVTGKSFVITATDTRGSAAGWHVTVSASDFSGDVGTFPASNLTLSAGTVTMTAGQATPLPTASAVTLSSSATKVLSANVGSGAGSYANTKDATLTVPGGTLVGEYQSILTVSINTGP